MFRVVIKDSKIIPVLTIPVLMFLLIFRWDENKMDILWISIATLGIILIRFYGIVAVGIILLILALILAEISCHDSRLRRIDSINNFLESFKNIKIEFAYQNGIYLIFRIAYLLFLTVVLANMILIVADDTFNRILYLVLSVFVFLVLCYFKRKKIYFD